MKITISNEEEFKLVSGVYELLFPKQKLESDTLLTQGYMGNETGAVCFEGFTENMDYVLNLPDLFKVKSVRGISVGERKVADATVRYVPYDRLSVSGTVLYEGKVVRVLFTLNISPKFGTTSGSVCTAVTFGEVDV